MVSRLLLPLMLAIAGGLSHAASTLYAASVRGFVSDGAQVLAGNLYKVDLTSRVFTLVGPIRVNGAPIGVTGLAEHPDTGELYGITSSSSPNHPHSLVVVDPATGNAAVIGDLGAAGTDIAFDGNGQLFVWLRETGQLGRIDLRTGRATALGTPGPPSASGGLAISPAGKAYVAVSGATGTLDRVDLATAATIRGVEIKGAPFAGINSLTLTPTDSLLAVNTNLGHPANTVLISIDPTTGMATQLGPLPNDTDALVFVEPPWTWREFFSSHGMLMAAMAAFFGAALAYMVFVHERRAPH